MIFWLLNIVAVFILSVSLTSLVIPRILFIAYRKNLFDIPDGRKVHTSVIPRLGGIAFNPVITFSFTLMVSINMSFGNDIVFSSFLEEMEPISYIFCSMIILYLIGVGDDLIGISYRGKFVAQLICALMFLTGGVYIDNLYGLFGFYTLPVWVAYPITVLSIIFIINAINLIDGIDGLASGLCCLSLVIYGITFYTIGQPIYSFISFCILGVLISFFYFNVFGNEAKQNKTFMGDAGSLTIGVLISALFIKLLKFAPQYDIEVLNPLILTCSPLTIPFFDVIRVYFSRVKRGKNPFLPDRSHIHHKLLDLGMGQRLAMISIILASMFFCCLNMLLSPYLNVTFVLLIDGFIWIFVNLWISMIIKSRRLQHKIV